MCIDCEERGTESLDELRARIKQETEEVIARYKAKDFGGCTPKEIIYDEYGKFVELRDGGAAESNKPKYEGDWTEVPGAWYSTGGVERSQT